MPLTTDDMIVISFCYIALMQSWLDAVHGADPAVEGGRSWLAPAIPETGSIHQEVRDPHMERFRLARRRARADRVRDLRHRRRHAARPQRVERPASDHSSRVRSCSSSRPSCSPASIRRNPTRPRSSSCSAPTRDDADAGTARDESVLHAPKISLRARNLNGDRLKVNDKRGNPIEIACVVVWHVEDTASAAFDVDDYEVFVKVQSEAAVRHLASKFAYDESEPQRGRQARADAARQRGHRRPRAGDRTAGAARPGRRRRRRGAPHAPGLRARDRAGHAAPPAGRGDPRRPAKIVTGAVSMVEMALNELSAKRRRARRRAQGVDGQQPDDGAVRGIGRAPGHQHRHALQLTKGRR